MCLLVLMFQCLPVAYYWGESIENGNCIDQNQFYICSGVINLILDFCHLESNVADDMAPPSIWPA